MVNIFFSSDEHISHRNIISYCNRPFQDTLEMDEYIIEKHNSVIKPNDHWYCLGDVYMSAKPEYINSVLSRMNGKKRLIIGNHDNPKDQILHRHFEKIMFWRQFEEVIFSHVPLRLDGFPGKSTFNVHGHIHTNPSPSGPYKCICVEQINYTPVSLEELKKCAAIYNQSLLDW